MIYKGVVRGRSVELEEDVRLPEGLEVRVVVGDRPGGSEDRSAVPQGVPGTVLAALEGPSQCSEGDVEALLAAIEEGKRAVRFRGPFDPQEAV